MMKIKDIFKLDSLSEAKLLTSKEKNDNIITSVNIMDAPDINNWVKKNELLLTTGFSIYTKIKNIDKFIKTLVSSGCAGLGIKSNRYFNNIPTEIIESADKYGLPIIEIPNEVVLGQILKEILVELSLKHRFQGDNVIPLLNNCLRFGNLKEVIYLIGKTINYSLQLESSFINENIEYQVCGNNTENAKIDKEVFIISKQDIVLGKLTIFVNKENIYKLKKDPIIHFSLNILKFLLNKKRLELTQNFKLKNEVIDKLINYQDSIRENLLEKLNFLNLDVSRRNTSFQIIKVSYEDLKEEKKDFENKLKKIIKNVESEFKDRANSNLIGGVYNNNIVFILLNKRTKKNNLNYLGVYIEYLKELNDLYFPSQEIAIGISQEDNKIINIKDLYNQSVKAANIAYERKDNIFKYRDLGILEKIYNPKNGVTLNKIINDNLTPIIKHKNREEYIKTLQTYFEFDENLNRAAANLYIHRNSLKYRLNKIENITDKNIEKLEDKLKLYLGIEAYKTIS